MRYLTSVRMICYTEQTIRHVSEGASALRQGEKHLASQNQQRRSHDGNPHRSDDVGPCRLRGPRECRLLDDLEPDRHPGQRRRPGPRALGPPPGGCRPVPHCSCAIGRLPHELRQSWRTSSRRRPHAGHQAGSETPSQNGCAGDSALASETTPFRGRCVRSHTNRKATRYASVWMAAIMPTGVFLPKHKGGNNRLVARDSRL